MKSLVQRTLRRRLRSERLYNLARRCMLSWQYLTKTPDDPEFRVFGKAGLGEGDLILDVGANGGQAAVALAALCPGSRILSFEPNPALWRELDFVGRLLRKRHSYLRFGLGDEAAEVPFFIPYLGRLPVTTRAGIDRAAVEEHAERLLQELGERPTVRESTIQIRRLDELDLSPAAVKIDVEGAELSVLRGMTRTLAESPTRLVFIENNARLADCAALLGDLGFQEADEGLSLNCLFLRQLDT
ncbi:MAG: FkbM family methyltransferase [Rhodospirillaceae bacterium]|nr:FkbM family methyltransferase [Rhodospirillaceae bacterium]